MLIKRHFNAILRARFGLNPYYDWAVENFDKMRRDIPGFERIYAGREPAKYIVVERTATHVRLEMGPGRWEWHLKEMYFFVPGLLK